MPFTLATWNINSVRLRAPLVQQLLDREQPDVLCLQECKSPVEKIPAFERYPHIIARGQKGYNGVAILSKRPIEDAGGEDFAQLGHARHIAGRMENGVVIHNFYVPAGGDKPDREKNEKFDQKLRFLNDMRDWARRDKPERAILVGDLNIAPREDDVWSHKQLLKGGQPHAHRGRASGRNARGWRLGRHHPQGHSRGQPFQLVVLPLT